VSLLAKKVQSARKRIRLIQYRLAAEKEAEETASILDLLNIAYKVR